MITNSEFIQTVSILWTITMYFIKCIPGIGILYVIGYFQNIKKIERQHVISKYCKTLLDEVIINEDQVITELRSAQTDQKTDREQLVGTLKSNFKILKEVGNQLSKLS